MNITKILDEVISHKIKVGIVDEYQAETSKAEGLGLVMASYFEWDGLLILETCIHALTDANFHTEAEEIQKLLDKVGNC